MMSAQDPKKTSTHLTPDMVGFRLLKLTNLLSRPFFGKFAKQYALNLNEWRAMVVIANSPGVASQDISAATGLNPMTISRAIGGLRRAQRIREEVDPDNHRRILIWLTDKGLETYELISPYSERQAKMLLEVLSPEEVQALSKITDKLVRQAEIIINE